MEVLTIIAVICTVISLVADRRKTWQGVSRGLIMFLNLLPAILMVLILVSISLFFLPEEFIRDNLGEEAGFGAFLLAALLGSVSLIPGFIAYPLSGMLVSGGVSYPVISVFITTLMMVGILTIPVEIRYFGARVTIVRNLLFFVAAIVIGGCMALIYSI